MSKRQPFLNKACIQGVMPPTTFSVEVGGRAGQPSRAWAQALLLQAAPRASCKLQQGHLAPSASTRGPMLG